jgi:cytochrome o ubiquinol oxidase subunit 1
MPFVIGLMNLVVPLQLGVRDVAFPTLNSVGFWLTATGALLVNVSLVVGEFARTGWLPYPPLSEVTYSPGVGVDYYLWSLQISGLGTLVAGINLVTTVLKIRTRGMNYMRMPMFCWTTLASNLLIIAAFPILTATLAMLILDRYLGFHFFTNEAGGNMMMFMNLIWAWDIPRSTSWCCRRSASSPKWSRRSRASRCLAIARWYSPPWRSASSPSWCGCTTSSPWARGPTSMPSSASPA